MNNRSTQTTVARIVLLIAFLIAAYTVGWAMWSIITARTTFDDDARYCARFRDMPVSDVPLECVE